MKVGYRDQVDGYESKAYLDDDPLPDGSYVGVNKHTDEHVHVRWDTGAQQWLTVCRRVYLPYNSYIDAPPGPEDIEKRPPCTCWSADT